MNQYSKETNEMLLKDVCANDETGIFEAIARISVEHGMPVENLSGFIVDLIGVINRWSEMVRK